MSEESGKSIWVPSTTTWFDKPYFNTLHFKKKKNSKHEFGIEVEPIIPSEGEVRLLGNRNKQCLYYQIGKENVV